MWPFRKKLLGRCTTCKGKGYTTEGTEDYGGGCFVCSLCDGVGVVLYVAVVPWRSAKAVPCGDWLYTSLTPKEHARWKIEQR